MTEVKKELTVFGFIPDSERKKAIDNLIKGKTPINEVKQRPMRGGGEANYVNTYYMTHQISLITGFRWTSECLEERILDKEIGAKMKVTVFDKDGNAFSQTSWGQKDIARWASDGKDHKAGEPISIFDDIKAAYSDGIKKCLSYFGIANDIYGGKELEYFATDEAEESSTVVMDDDKAKRAFNKYITDKGLKWSEVFTMLEVKSMSDITDYKEAYNKVKQILEKGGDATQ